MHKHYLGPTQGQLTKKEKGTVFAKKLKKKLKQELIGLIVKKNRQVSFEIIF